MPRQATGERQGNRQLGFEICPHTCGCLITDAVAKRSRRAPKWLQWAPLALKDGSHIGTHSKNQEVHPNCSPACPNNAFRSVGRELTVAEHTAWTPHLGHYSPFHVHIPPQYHPLIPAQPLEDLYAGVLPPHPLPPAAVPHLAMASLAIQPAASSSGSGVGNPPTGPLGSRASMAGPGAGPSHTQPEPSGNASGSRTSMASPPVAGPSNTRSGPSSEAPSRKVLFIEMPRLDAPELDVDKARGILSYSLYVVPDSASARLRQAIRSALPGFAYREDEERYQIHDTVRIP